VADLVRRARGATVIAVDTCEPDLQPAEAPAETAEVGPRSGSLPEGAAPPLRPTFAEILSAPRIILWDRPVAKEEVLRSLAARIAGEAAPEEAEALFGAIMERERLGSTFYNEGVAFPHVRLPGRAQSLIALGLTRGGVLDVATEKPIEEVFLILSPSETPDAQVHLLGLTSRAAQDRHLLQNLRSITTREEALRLILDWESPSEGQAAD
jgi:mannitol/fructose-specific phosphotransferase system IIA component (Ntr-type)